MQRRTIYKITVSYQPSTLYVKESEPSITFYSNLKRSVESVQTTLVVQGWEEHRLNYSAVYRAIKERGKYVEDFAVNGLKFFKLTIEPVTLNPLLTTLGIDEKPN